MKRPVQIRSGWFALAAFLAVAAPSLAHAEAAVVVHDTGCVMPDIYGQNTVFTADSTAVGTASDNCNSMISCKAKIPNPTKKAITFNYTSTGLACSTTFGITTDWQEVISASGSATLSCHINTCN